MLADPRTFPADAPPPLARLHALAQASLGAATGAESAAIDATIEAALRAWLDAGDGASVAALLACAPSVDAHRHLVRVLAAASAPSGDGIAVTLFAIPVVLVAASTRTDRSAVIVDGVLPDAPALSGTLREHGALAGNRTIALANVLAGAASLEPGALPALRAAARLPAAGSSSPLAPAPAPLKIDPGNEVVHVRFLVGTALAAPGAALLREPGTGRWGMPLAKALAAQLAVRDASLLALPRPAHPIATATQAGRAAQREVSAQIFASNAIRRLRASFGEPSAVISAHRLREGRGEIRLSLSTPFDLREAEGLRCPLFPFDRAADVVAMLVDLMRDCRVGDIRVVDGVHPDRDPGTGLPLLFKPETIPADAPVTVH